VILSRFRFALPACSVQDSGSDPADPLGIDCQANQGVDAEGKTETSLSDDSS
jgi:hypothetical protein